MKISIIVTLITSAIILSCSCSRVEKTEAEREREEWIAGFNDSISYYKNLSDDITLKLDNLNSEINTLLENFEFIRNPREVSGYYIMKGWNSKLPFVNTGIYARINEGEKLELIATLGGATFNQISVGGIRSEVRHHDQAFNFRHERFNTVYFSGEETDSLARYIYENKNNALKLEYLEGNRPRVFSLPENEKNMVAQTWLLYSNQSEAHKLQKELWIASRKIETFRRLLNMENAEKKE